MSLGLREAPAKCARMCCLAGLAPALILGTILLTVATASPDVVQIAAARVRHLALAGIGPALLRHGRTQLISRATA